MDRTVKKANTVKNNIRKARRIHETEESKELSLSIYLSDLITLSKLRNRYNKIYKSKKSSESDKRLSELAKYNLEKLASNITCLISNNIKDNFFGKDKTL